jgi:DNA-binding response OmpR family regulator
MTTILIVDDDRAMVGMVAAMLGDQGYDLVTAYDGEQALRRHADDPPDLIVLDRRLPRLDGDEVTRRIRAVADTPILMLTGERGSAQRVALLDAGADDYLEKPFDRKELVARVRALLRRAHGPKRAAGPVAVGALTVDARTHSATVEGVALALTPTEFRLLAALASRAGEVVDRKALLRAAWPDERDPDPEWLKAHLARLRSKLEEARGPVPVNVRGVGYRLGAAR